MARERLDGLTAKVETVYRTDAVPVAGTDGVQLDERMWGSIEIDFLEENERPNAHVGRLSSGTAGPPCGRFGHVTVTGALKGASVAYAAGVTPEMLVLLRGCSHSAAVTTTAGSEKWVCTPSDTAQDSLTLYCYAAGKLFKLVGCRGKLSMDFDAAKIGMFKMEFWGLVLSITDVSLPALTYPRLAVIPPAVASSTMLLNAVGLPYKSFKFDQGATIAAAPRGNAVDGHAGYEVTEFNPTATAVVDSPTLATFDPYALGAAASPFAWSITLGTSQYNKVTIAGANAQMGKTGHEADSGYAMNSLPLKLRSTPALPAYTITFD